MRHAHCADAAQRLADRASKGSAGCIALQSSASLPPPIPQHGPASGKRQAHHGRYSDRPIHWRTRLSGMSGTAMIFALMLGCAAFRWQRQPIIATASPPLVVTLQPLAAPPEPVEELPEGPRQVERRQQKAQERLLPSPPDILLPRLSPLSSPTHDPVEPAQAVDPIPETMAPKSVPAPPARQASSRQDMGSRAARPSGKISSVSGHSQKSQGTRRDLCHLPYEPGRDAPIQQDHALIGIGLTRPGSLGDAQTRAASSLHSG